MKSTTNIFVILIFVLVNLSCSQLTAGEQQALLDLANSLTPLPTGWNTVNSTNACSWGSTITCYAGHITQLAITGLSGGTIPATISGLSSLTSLSLTSNQLIGSIPPEIGNIITLTTLILTDNRLTGNIPATLANIPNLSSLYLNKNRLTGAIPSELGNLSKLVYLILSENQLTGSIPASIGYLKSLQYLYLEINQLSGSIPPEIGNLTNMVDIRLDINALTGTIPETVNNMTQLTNFYVYQNSLTGTIPDIGNLRKMRYFYLHQNQLSGTIPASIGNLDSLYYLYLYNNVLSGTVPDSIGNLALLQTLYLHQNRLSGTLPESIGNLLQLQNLYFQGNSLLGTIPASLGNLTQLQVLSVETNQLTGTIPDLSKLSSLKDLRLGGNKLNGTIPASLGNCFNLGTLNLYSNKLSGTIPLEFYNLKNLIYLYMYDNNLSGTISPSIGQLNQLKVIQMYMNKFNGTIPSEIGNLTVVQDLEFSTNQIIGTIPQEITSLSQLQTLWLSDNRLSGTIPAGFSSIAGIKRLQLQNNNLEGCFDETLPTNIICDVSNNPLACHPEQCMFTSLVPALQPTSQPELSHAPTNTDNLTVALGVSIPVGCAVIAGIIVLIIFIQKRKTKKRGQHHQSELLHRDGKANRLSQVLPSNMIINFKDLKLGKELGSGDFGKVFEGEWQKSKVAIKVNTSGDIESFYNEAELMLNLRPHPNVVQTLGYCQADDKLVVVVEFCDGGSLDKKLFDENDTVPPIDQFNLIWNIAKGVYHLHANNIIHRDLAARNILLSRGVPKISDFGLSRKVEQVQKHSQTKTTLGPIRWMAPESLRSPIYDEKTDVWSFGIVCWEIVCRQEPHLNEDPLSIGGKIRDECFTPLIPDDCNPKIKQLMKDCWNPNPEDRPDIKSICDRLEKIFVQFI